MDEAGGSEADWPLVVTSRPDSLLRRRQSLYEAVLQVRMLLRTICLCERLLFTSAGAQQSLFVHPAAAADGD